MNEFAPLFAAVLPAVIVATTEVSDALPPDDFLITKAIEVSAGGVVSHSTYKFLTVPDVGKIIES